MNEESRNTLGMPGDRRTAQEIAAVNDLIRRSLVPTPGGASMLAGSGLGLAVVRVVTTATVAESPLFHKVVLAVRDFNQFNEGNDPYGDHDFGKFEVDGEAFIFKFDYYDLNFEYGEDPYDSKAFARVLTIMRADEY